MDFLLIGHRTSGKTTLAKTIAALHPHLFDVIDLDEVIEHQEERTCAQIIADHEPYFRQLEIAYLDKILAQKTSSTPHRIIVPGAGCLHLPPEPCAIWLQRDGWVDTAVQQRARLRPMRSYQDEVQWMQQRREPVWAARAQATLELSRGSQLAHNAQRLSEILLAIIQAPDSTISHKSFVVPSSPDELDVAIHTQRNLNLAGVEIRSDLLPNFSPSSIQDTPVLASVRTPDDAWIERLALQSEALDIDIDLLDKIDKSNLTHEHTQLIILSSHPHKDASNSSQLLDDLVAHADTLLSTHAELSKHKLVLKFAPWHTSYKDTLETLIKVQSLTPHWNITYIPQGPNLAWMRPWLATHINATNYIPATLLAHHTHQAHQTIVQQAALDLQDWLPHLASQAPTQFNALLGDPVHQSRGDWWHRMSALREHAPEESYLKIPFAKTHDTHEWTHLLNLLEHMGVCGLSVTSPHKRTICTLEQVDSTLDAANTLGFKHQSWHAIDTDHHGLIATLDFIKSQGIPPGDVIIIGQGGVSPAVQHALEQRKEWTIVHHASARQGWTKDTPTQATLIINAAGDMDSPYESPPICTVWLDLHYKQVRTPPPCELHLNGEIFFDAQAKAQREFWANTHPQ